jgi:hypothetical protein
MEEAVCSIVYNAILPHDRPPQGCDITRNIIISHIEKRLVRIVIFFIAISHAYRKHG